MPMRSTGRTAPPAAPACPQGAQRMARTRRTGPRRPLLPLDEAIQRVGPKALADQPSRPSRVWARLRPRSASRSSPPRWSSRSPAHVSWPRASPARGSTSSWKPRSTACRGLRPRSLARPKSSSRASTNSTIKPTHPTSSGGPTSPTSGRSAEVVTARRLCRMISRAASWRGSCARQCRPPTSPPRLVQY